MVSCASLDIRDFTWYLLHKHVLCHSYLVIVFAVISSHLIFFYLKAYPSSNFISFVLSLASPSEFT